MRTPLCGETRDSPGSPLTAPSPSGLLATLPSPLSSSLSWSLCLEDCVSRSPPHLPHIKYQQTQETPAERFIEEVFKHIQNKATIVRKPLQHLSTHGQPCFISAPTHSFLLFRYSTLCDPWTVAHQPPPSMGFSRQEYWRGLPFPSPGDLPNPGIEPRSPALRADALTSEPPGKPQIFGRKFHLLLFHYVTL